MPVEAAHAKRGKKVLVVIGIFGALFVIASGVVFALILSSPSVQRFMTLASESRRITKAGESAPGAAEVKAAGACEVVTIDDMSEIAELGRKATDAGTPEEAQQLTGKIVVCIVPALRTAPTCDALANAYVDAAHPEEQFYVTVRRLGATDSTCTQGYSSVGDHLGSRRKK